MIYADNAATTRISDSVFEKMLPFLCEQYGNASSQYSLGVKAKRAIEQARKQIATAIRAERPFVKRRKAEPGIFSGLLYCAGCGTRLISNCQTNKKVKVFWYYCSTSRATSGIACPPHTIGEATLKNLVLSNIKEQAELISIDRDGVLKRLQGSLSTHQRTSKSDSLKRQRELEGRLHSIEVQTEKLYEDKVMGVISNDDFTRVSQQLENERREKSAQLDFLKQTVAEVKQKLCDIDRWVKLIEECSVLDNVDANLLETLIGRIEIGENRVENGLKTRDVRIFYKYVGLV